MPTIAEIRQQYPQYNDMSDTQLADALHSKFYSDMPRADFDKKIGLKAPAADKYHQAAIDEAIKAPSPGFTRQLAHGATLGADTTILAALETPLEMVRRGTLDPREGYAYAKAREDQILSDARNRTGIPGQAVEALGGAVSAGGLANAGFTAARFLPQGAGWLARTGAGAADAAAIGGISGAMEGNGLDERAKNAAIGAGVGAGVGAATPGVLAALRLVTTPITSQIAARINPRQYAEAQVARAISEGTMTPRDLEVALAQAQREGQGQYTLADALGNPGQRMLSTVARAPGEGRTAVVDAMEARQAGQGRRVASALAEGFDSPATAAQTRDAMTAARDTAANAEYGAVRAGANPVDVVPAINNIDRTIGTGPGQQLHAPNDSIEGVLRGFRERIARVNPDDFAAVQRIRADMADAAQSAAQGGHNNRARLIRSAMGELDTAMEQASPGFRQAQANFRQASQNIEAIDAGRTAALRGRTEDTIPAYQALPQEGQNAFRAGYVDPLIEQAQGAAYGANKARPLTSDAFQQEAAAIAPGNDLMQRRLGREMRMFETRNQALGGSRTADNLADAQAMAVNPEVMGVVRNIMSGNFGGAVKGALSAGYNAFTGNTAAVRDEVARILLQNGRNISPGRLQAMVDAIVNRSRRAAEIADRIRSGAVGGAAVAGPGRNRR